MIGVYLFAWVVFGLLMLVLSTGAGLGLQRVAGARAVPGVLVVPAGLAVLVIVSGLFCYFAALAPLAGPACVVVGVLGLIAGAGRLKEMLGRRGRGLDVWAILAAVGAWAVVAAPIVLSGKPGFTGYAHIVDTSYEFDLSAHFASAGRSAPTATNSAYQVVLFKYLANGYPGGAQATLGALSNLTPIDLSWLYQPFLAFMAAATALSLYALLSRLVASRALRALGAFIAAQANILIAYTYAGGIKELSTACFLLLSAALLAQLLPRPGPGRALLAAPFALAATYESLSLTTLPWLGVLCAGVLLSVLIFERDRVRTLLAGAQMAALGIVLALPTIAVSFKLLPVTGAPLEELGNLSQRLPSITAAGVWIAGDYRYPQDAHTALSEVIAVVVIVLAAFGIVTALRRRAWSLAWLGLAGLIAEVFVAHRYGAWVQLKADCITAPIALLMAFAGAGALVRATGRPLVGVLPACVVAAGVLAGSALLYHDTTLAPYSRLHDLEQIGKRFARQGPTLTPDFEEYAEYYLRDDDQDSMVNGPRLELRPGVNRETEPGNTWTYDMDELPLKFIESFRTIVMRRSPLASRPPSNYRLVSLSPYYEVWQRQGSPQSISTLVPVSWPHVSQKKACASLAAAARASGPGARLAYMPAPSEYVQVDDSNMKLAGGFAPSGGVILATGAGHATRRQLIPVAGTYDFFIEGSFGRPVDVLVDGHKVAAAAYQVSYPGEWIEIASRPLTQGTHRIELVRGGASLHAGSGDGVDDMNRTVGPLVIMSAKTAVPALRYAAVGALARLCASAAPPRWIEVLHKA